MSYSITLNSETQSWTKDLELSQYKELQELLRPHRNKKCPTSFMRTTFIPVRTNKIENFLTDLFVPTLVHRALKIQNITIKIFAIIGALIFDLMTLPIRLLTSIPRIITNKEKPTDLKNHLAKLLNKNILETDWLEVILIDNSVPTDEPGIPQLINQINRDARIQRIGPLTAYFFTTFIDLPAYPTLKKQ